jgi:nitroreductase
MSLDPTKVPATLAVDAPAPPVVASPELVRILAERRSSKPFHLGEPAPSRAQVEAILALAARVPDHGKLAAWRFLVISDAARARLGEKLAAIVAARPETPEPVVEAQRAQFTRSALCVAVISTAAPHAKIPEWEQILSAGALCYNVILAAQGFGFGGVWLSGPAAYDEAAREVFGLARGERIAGFIHLGTQSEPATERPRPDVAALTTWA